MRFISFLTIYIISISANCQQFEAALLPAKKGAMLVYNGDSLAFTIRLEFDSLKPANQPNFIIIDDWIFQSFILGFDNPNEKDLTQKEFAKEALATYVNYELEYFKKELNIDYTNPVIEQGEINGLHFFFWYFNTPPAMKTIHKQVYLTTICFNHFLNLNVPLEHDKTIEDGKAFLLNIGSNITLHNHKIDLDKLYYELNE